MLFRSIFQAGIEGAAFATGIGQTIPAIVGLIVFFNKKKELHFCKFKWDGKALLKACSNGASEMVTHMSAAIVTFLFNIIMMKLAGESGVAAITIVLYGQFLFHSMYLGYSMGVAPIFSFQYGANNQRQLKNVFKLSILFITISSVIITIASFGLADFIVAVFVERGSKTFLLAKSGFFLFSINYLFCGTNIFASSLFTALSDGKTSAIISFLRTFFFIIVSLLTLPAILGITGVWLAVPFAELLTIFIAIMYLVRKKKIYNY